MINFLAVLGIFVLIGVFLYALSRPSGRYPSKAEMIETEKTVPQIKADMLELNGSVPLPHDYQAQRAKLEGELNYALYIEKLTNKA